MQTEDDDPFCLAYFCLFIMNGSNFLPYVLRPGLYCLVILLSGYFELLYRTERKYGVFSKLDACTFVTNVYNDGNILSIVTDSSPHGTHVAGIASAFHPKVSQHANNSACYLL